MALTKYDPSYDFGDFSSVSPDLQLPGVQVDAQFDALSVSVNALVDAVNEVRRADGRLANESVHPAAFDAASRLLIAGWTLRGSWTTATAYAVADAVVESTIIYVCIEAHTSGTFATDLSGGKWLALSNTLPSPTGEALNYIRQKSDESGFEYRTPSEVATDIGLSAFGKTLVDDADAATARATLGIDGPLGGFRNLLINGRGQINQDGYVSGAATSGANEYTIDRWRVVVSGESLSWTESAGTKTFTAPAGGVEQEIEGDNIVSGTYVISFTGNASCTVDGVSKSSGDTVTLTGGTNATVRFSSGTWSLPQLEPGDTATPFEPRPKATELALCERYLKFRRHRVTVFYDLGTTGNSFIWKFPLEPKMRASPTVSVVTAHSLSNFNNRLYSGTEDTLTVSVDNSNTGARTGTADTTVRIDAEL